jgi:hypothetical protein
MHVADRHMHSNTLVCICCTGTYFLQATEIQAGMDIFSIPKPPYKELAFLEHELELLSRMWGAVADWEATYSGWKNGHFKELKVCRMLLIC